MRYEERSNKPILVVEPDDERTVVLNWLGLYSSRLQQRGPIVVVVPQDAVFRRPGDLRELQQTIAGQYANKNMLILVLEGNERLRLWARQQGFNAYATLETCLKACMPQGMIQDGSQAQLELPVTHELPSQSFTGYSARHNQPEQDNDTQGETYRSSFAVANSRTTSGSHLLENSELQTGSVYMSASAAHRTEPLLDQYLAAIPALSLPSDPSLTLVAPVPDERSLMSRYQCDYTVTPQISHSSQTPLPVAAPYTFYDEEYTEAATGDWQRYAKGPWGSRTHERQVQEVLRTDDLFARQMGPGLGVVALHMQRIRQDRLLLLLVVLIALGILGGIGFGYLGHLLNAL
jgi:hypothetical protein